MTSKSLEKRTSKLLIYKGLVWAEMHVWKNIKLLNNQMVDVLVVHLDMVGSVVRIYSRLPNIGFFRGRKKGLREIVALFYLKD